MQIRTRLTLQFLLIGGIIMIVASVAIYYSSAVFRKEDFYSRMLNKANSTARLLLDENVIDPDRVLKIEKDNPIKLQNERIIIYNFLDNIVYSSDEKDEIKIPSDAIARIRLGNNLAYTQDPYEVLGTLYFARLDRFVVIIAAVDSQGKAHLRKLGIILTVVCLFSFLVFFAAGWLYSGRALKPISEVIRNVEDISIASLHLRVPEGNGTDEIGRLAKTFNKMLARLESSFAMQKDFIANASHELRTPLTSINGQLEVLMMKDRSTEEYTVALGSVLEDIRKLIDISNRLLLIARTSDYQVVNLTNKVRIDEVLWQAREEALKFNGQYRISISMNQDAPDEEIMTVRGDEYLLKVAVSNIIDNACKYSPDNSVVISFEYSDSGIEIVFEDKGIGIPANETGKVFEPFYRGSNAVKFPGSGIGLQLVNQIITKHNGSVVLTSAEGKGTCVRIKLPVYK